MTALSLDIRIEQRALEVSDSRGLAIRGWLSNLFSRLGNISLSKWVTRKLVNSIGELSEMVEEVVAYIPEMEKAEAEKLYKTSQKSIVSLIKFNESLEEVEYLNNSELKKTFTRCLDVFYAMEAKAKKNAKSGSFKGSDKNIKVALSEKSNESIGLKLSK